MGDSMKTIEEMNVENEKTEVYFFSARIPCGLAPGMNCRLSFK